MAEIPTGQFSMARLYLFNIQLRLHPSSNILPYSNRSITRKVAWSQIIQLDAISPVESRGLGVDLVPWRRYIWQFAVVARVTSAVRIWRYIIFARDL